MNIVLGFGKTEKDFVIQEFDFVEEFLQERSNTFTDKYDFGFSDGLIDELNVSLSERKEKYDQLAKEYKTAENYPERYTTYYFDVLHSVGNLCVVFVFSHINRHHPMSPDGWAMFGEKKVYHANVWDFRE